MEQKQETVIGVPVSTWSQIDLIAAQIANPSTEYSDDRLKMANAVIEDNRRLAEMIRKLVPTTAKNSF